MTSEIPSIAYLTSMDRRRFGSDTRVSEQATSRMGGTMFSLGKTFALASLAVLAAVPAAAFGGTSSQRSEASSARWTITDLGTLGPGWRDSSAAAINAHGQVVGTDGTASGRQHAFLCRNGKLTDLGTLGGRDSGASAINGRGQAIGTSLTAKPSRTHAFLWQGGKMTDLGTLGGRSSRPRAINELGQVVGESFTSSGRVHAFL